jgi:hypothetical protein
MYVCMSAKTQNGADTVDQIADHTTSQYTIRHTHWTTAYAKQAEGSVELPVLLQRCRNVKTIFAFVEFDSPSRSSLV